jgi:hypothetical protein
MGEKFEGDLKHLVPTLKILKDKVPQVKGVGVISESFGHADFYMNGVYKHFGYGFSLALGKAGFKLAGETETPMYHPEALIAATKGNCAVYLLAYPESIPEELLIEDWYAQISETQKLQKPVKKAGRYISAAKWKNELGRWVLDAYNVRGSSALLVGWIPMKQLKIPYKQTVLTSMTKPEITKGLEKLRGDFAPVTYVGGQSFYKNVYRNFDLGFQWQLDPKDVVTADASGLPAFDASHMFVVENHSKKWFARLMFQDSQFVDGKEYHKNSLKDFPETISAPSFEKNGFYYSSFQLKNQPLHYLLITSAKDDAYVRMLVYSNEKVGVEKILKQVSWNQTEPLITKDGFVYSMRFGYGFLSRRNIKVRIKDTPVLGEFGELLHMGGIKANDEWLLVFNSPMADQDMLLDIWQQETQYTEGLETLDTREYKYRYLDVTERSFKVVRGKQVSFLYQSVLKRGNTWFCHFKFSRKKTKASFYQANGFRFDLPR